MPASHVQAWFIPDTGQQMLTGFQGVPPVDRENDINPLLCGGEGPIAVDATIILE